ncbi:helix-turn-helix domain-containing protein [Cedecea neteri]|uniref:helix-turn-helix domain-containing protein n=1 Tax=Cedecea neteri TaxID=158822 RepID=UPI0004F80BE2|nr:helix-turn-helix domain-containing protein [Cedecea neteri]AIR64709.1 transcriptional regulator, AraC family protein [Cedecea neteri]
MPAIPLPFYTLTVLLLLLLKILFSRHAEYRNAAIFLSGCAILILMSALRWTFDAVILRQLQSLAAIALPPLAWYCFASLPRQRGGPKIAAYWLAPLSALIVNLAAPAMTDIALMFLFIGYGSALIKISHLGVDSFIFSRLSDANITASTAFFAGCFLCFSGLVDLAIAVDFRFFGGMQAPILVALSQTLLLPFIGMAVVFKGKVAPPPKMPDAQKEAVQEHNDEELTALYHHIEKTLLEDKLFLDPDITLSLIGKASGIAPRQLSRAINQICGCNVSQWVNGFRVRHAQALLRNTGVPVTQIMLDSGFSTKSHFNKEFARLSGSTPTDFRRLAGENPVPD